MPPVDPLVEVDLDPVDEEEEAEEEEEEEPPVLWPSLVPLVGPEPDPCPSDTGGGPGCSRSAEGLAPCF